MSQLGKQYYILLATIALVMSACGEIKTISKAGFSSNQCPINNKLASQNEENVFAQKTLSGKVVISDFTTDDETNGSSKIKNSHTIKKGQRFIASVDIECLESSVGYGTITKNIKVRNKRKRTQSKIESHEIIAENDLALDNLELIAQEDPCVKMVSPNVITKVAAHPNDPLLSSQPHLQAIKYNDTFDFFFTGSQSINSDVTIAMIDDGIDLNHSDIKNNLWINTVELNGQPGVDDDGNGYIDDIHGYNFASSIGSPQHEGSATHGTHVAGLMAASTNNSLGTAGVIAKNAKIMSLNIFGASEFASTANIDSAIRYAADMGAKIINMSISGKGRASSTEVALRYAVNKGATVFIAAGNEGETLTSSNFFTPASYGASIAGAITIGATDARSTTVGSLCNFSNRSSTYVELGAPGCNTALNHQGLLSLIKNNEYGHMAGTSMAAPVAAGAGAAVYALLRDVYGAALTPAQLESFLKEGSRNVSSINTVISNGKNLDLLTLKTKIESEHTPAALPICP